MKLYSAKLSEFPLEDVCAVCAEIADTPRREGETAFPERGALVARLRRIESDRRYQHRVQAQRAQQEANFWQWVDERIEDTGKPEQEILDAVKVLGFAGRMARNDA